MDGFYCHAMATDWKISSLFPSFCVCTNICPGFNQKRADACMRGCAERWNWQKFSGIRKRNDNTDTVKERKTQSKTLIPTEDFQLLLRVRLLSHTKQNRSSLDTVLPAALRFILLSCSPALIIWSYTRSKQMKRGLKDISITSCTLTKMPGCQSYCRKKHSIYFPHLYRGWFMQRGGHGGWNLPAVLKRPTSLQHLHDESVRATGTCGWCMVWSDLVSDKLKRRLALAKWRWLETRAVPIYKRGWSCFFI